jgi:excisionase family DNA binding protein
MTTPKPSAARLLPTTQAGRALARTGQTVRRMIASGQLRGIKIGDRWLVDAASVAEHQEPRP